MKIVSMLLLLVTLLPGCAIHPGLFAEIDGNIQHRTGASDWTLPGGREYIGQVQAVVGVERRGLSVFAGFNHLSLPEYGHDRGFNGEVVGVSYRHYFLKSSVNSRLKPQLFPQKVRVKLPYCQRHEKQ